MNEPIQIRGDWTFRVIGPNGELKDERCATNKVVNAGLDYLADYAFLGSTPTSQPDAMAYIAIGTDSTTVTATDTALGSELTRQAFDTITPGGVGVITFDASFAAGVGTGSIAEAGTFNDPTTGDMLNRVDFAAVNKTASDTLKVTCTITFTSS